MVLRQLASLKAFFENMSFFGIGFDWGITKPDLEAIWKVRFEDLCEFKTKFGHCSELKVSSANPKLGQWVAKQRSNYKWYQEGKPCHMTAERIRELESIGFKWELQKISWNERLEQLREYKVQFGDCWVPIKYSANPNLGKWVSNQRSNYRLYQQGKPSRITAEHIRQIDAIGFEWGTGKADSAWRIQFQELCEFNVQFGHCIVPLKYSANPKLGNWVSKQRSNHRRYQEGNPSPTMTVERIRELDGIGFDWGITKTDLETTWKVRFEDLCEFKTKFGHCSVLKESSANPKLGNWVSKQRYNYKRYQEGKPSPMTAERIRELESILFNWDPQKQLNFHDS